MKLCIDDSFFPGVRGAILAGKPAVLSLPCLSPSKQLFWLAKKEPQNPPLHDLFLGWSLPNGAGWSPMLQPKLSPKAAATTCVRKAAPPALEPPPPSVSSSLGRDVSDAAVSALYGC